MRRTTENTEKFDMNLCFQLAICYNIGFGGPADTQKQTTMLQKSGKTDQDLTDILEKLKSREATSDASTGVIYNTLKDMGSITYQDLASQYYACEILDDAEKEIMRDVENLRASLGRRNAFWTISATLLAEIYMMTGRTQDAQTWYIKVMEVMIEEFGKGHENAMFAAQNASIALFANGALMEAERIQIRVLETRQENSLRKAIQNLINAGQHGNAIYEMDDVSIEVSDATEISFGAQMKIDDLSGRISDALMNGELERADALQYETWQLVKEVAGPDHSSALGMLHGLIDKFFKRGEWDEVERLQSEEILLHKKRFGPEHSRTLGRMSNLSETFSRQGKWNEARKLQEECLATCVRCLSPQHTVTKVVMTNLMNSYRKLGLDDEYISIRRELENYFSKELTAIHLIDRDTSDSMALLASTYQAQGRMGDADSLLRYVLEEREKRLGIEHPDTKQTMSLLARIREQLGKSK